jgi:hypothetical protein
VVGPCIGHDFEIVASLTVKAYALVNGGMHWSGMLVFQPEKLENLVELLNGALAKEGMSCLTISCRLPPAFEPVVLAFPWYAGPEDTARENSRACWILDQFWIKAGWFRATGSMILASNERWEETHVCSGVKRAGCGEDGEHIRGLAGVY